MKKVFQKRVYEQISNNRKSKSDAFCAEVYYVREAFNFYMYICCVIIATFLAGVGYIIITF